MKPLPFKAVHVAPNHIAVEIPPSVNHQYAHVVGHRKDGKPYASRALTKAAKDWIDAVHLVVQEACRKSGWRTRNLKTIVELEAFWPDRRRRDIHNLHKIVADSLEDYGDVELVIRNDSCVLMRDKDYHHEKENPRLEISWREFEE